MSRSPSRRGWRRSSSAADAGDLDHALDPFRSALPTDLADVAGNTSDGVHTAAAGGVWPALVRGSGGVEDESGEPVTRGEPHRLEPAAALLLCPLEAW
jgi:trehalose/maltose hydrolase-like predicted phosphorylase